MRYPGRVPSLVRMSLTDGSVQELAEVVGAVPYKVTSLAFDDADRDLVLHVQQHAPTATCIAYDVKTGSSRTLLSEARIGDLAFNPADRSLWGLRTNNGFVMIVRIPYPYREWKSVHVYPYGEVPFDLDISRDGKLVSLSLAGPDEARSGMQVMQLRVMPTERLLIGDATPTAPVRARHGRAGRLRVLGRRPLPLRQFLLHRRVQHIPV